MCLYMYTYIHIYCLSYSFHRISSGESSRPIEYRSVNLNAGAEILQRYQTEWHDGHQLAEENAAKAQVCRVFIEVYLFQLGKLSLFGSLCRYSLLMCLCWFLQAIDEVIGGLHVTFEKQWNGITQLNSTMAAIPQIISSTQSLMEQLGKSNIISSVCVQSEIVEIYLNKNSAPQETFKNYLMK